MMKVKGSALVYMPKTIEKKFGKPGLSKWLAALSPYARTMFQVGVTPDEWYPLKQMLIEPTANICGLFYKWDFRGAWEFGRFSADYSLKGIYKFFIRLGSPNFLVGKASEIMSTYYDPSTMQVIENNQKSALVRITRFSEMDKIVEFRICGWIERALEINGCKQVKIDITTSMTNMKPYSEFHVSWEK